MPLHPPLAVDTYVLIHFLEIMFCDYHGFVTFSDLRAGGVYQPRRQGCHPLQLRTLYGCKQIFIYIYIYLYTYDCIFTHNMYYIYIYIRIFCLHIDVYIYIIIYICTICVSYTLYHSLLHTIYRHITIHV